MDHPNIGRKRTVYACMLVMFIFSVLSIIFSSISTAALFTFIAILFASDTIVSLVKNKLFRSTMYLLPNFMRHFSDLGLKEFVLF